MLFIPFKVLQVSDEQVAGERESWCGVRGAKCRVKSDSLMIGFTPYFRQNFANFLKCLTKVWKLAKVAAHLKVDGRNQFRRLWNVGQLAHRFVVKPNDDASHYPLSIGKGLA